MPNNPLLIVKARQVGMTSMGPNHQIVRIKRNSKNWWKGKRDRRKPESLKILKWYSTLPRKRFETWKPIVDGAKKKHVALKLRRCGKIHIAATKN